MAIYRTVHISFWSDSKVVDDFSPEDKYFFIYLLTNPHTNLCGCYEISLKQMADETGYSKETISKLIERFQFIHKVLNYSTQTKEMFIFNWSKYNWTRSPKLRAALTKEIPMVKNPVFKAHLSKALATDSVSIPYSNGINTSVTNAVTDVITDAVAVADLASDSSCLKHNYGEYCNVLLTDNELAELKSEFADWAERIERLSAYIASSGKEYFSHFATIRLWAKNDLMKHQRQNGGHNYEDDDLDFIPN